MTDFSFSKITRKPDGSFDVLAENSWVEVHIKIGADAATQLAAALGVPEAGISRGWHTVLGESDSLPVREWLDAHEIPHRTVFAWTSFDFDFGVD